MTLRLNGSTSGYTEIDAPAAAGNNTLVLPTGNGTNGQVLQTNGSGTLSWAAVSASGSLIRAPQILTTGTSYTTPAGCTGIYVEAVGGGGGGRLGQSTNGNEISGAGGGAGAYCAHYFSVSANTAYSYAIGAGGTVNGGNGGDTTFTVGAVTITAGGGTAGTTSSSTAAPGGTATNGTLNVTGNYGMSLVLVGGLNAGGQLGGASFFGGVGRAGVASTTGSGGCGGGSTVGNTAAGAGGAGLIRIWEYR